MRQRVGWQVGSLIIAVLLCAPAALAGPPFLTDDPEPVEFKNWEAYLFSTADHATDGLALQGPAVEVNAGALPNLQIHFTLPLAILRPESGPSHAGLGDAELGLKYRFLQESARRPQVGTFPIILLPTGNSNLGLGNGVVWARLPLWLQKSWGPWTSYGGGGYAINTAPGMRNHAFGGGLLQRDLNKWLTLGGEVFAQGADTFSSQGTTIGNLGGILKASEHFNLLFSAGHSLWGEPHTVAYLALYWTWGPGTTK
jgi:hypothetical protein